MQQAERHLAGFVASGATPLLAAAHGVFARLAADGARGPIRSALIRFWVRHRVLLVPVPLTAAAALRADAPFTPSAWPPGADRSRARPPGSPRMPGFPNAAATRTPPPRSTCSPPRRCCRRPPSRMVWGLSIKTGTRLLDGLVASGVAIEVTHRAKRRLFALAGMAPLAQVVRPPYRPEPGRGRGRSPLLVDEPVLPPPAPPRPLTPIERRQFDYSDLEYWMDYLDQTIRRTRQSLQVLARPGIDLSGLGSTVSSVSMSCAGDRADDGAQAPSDLA